MYFLIFRFLDKKREDYSEMNGNKHPLNLMCFELLCRCNRG